MDRRKFLQKLGLVAAGACVIGMPAVAVDDPILRPIPGDWATITTTVVMDRNAFYFGCERSGKTDFVLEGFKNNPLGLPDTEVL